MSETFKYKVTEFDDLAKVVQVEFEDGSWARIELNEPLPSDVDELSAVVAVYTSPVEHEQAIKDPTADLTFISDIVGQEVQGARRWITPPIDPVNLDEEIDSMIEQEIGAQATPNQLVSEGTMKNALSLYQNNLQYVYGPLREKMTEASQASYDVFMQELADIAVAANDALVADQAYDVEMPTFDLEFVK